jgi:MFS family permease
LSTAPLRGDVRDIAIVEFANGLAFASFVPFLALWLTGPVGMSPLAAGVTGFGVYSLTAIAGSMAGGVLSDRVGRRPVMVAGLAAGTARLLALALTTDPWLVTALIAFGGLVDSVVGPASGALVADRVPANRLNEAYGTTRAARTLALGLGPVLGAALAPLSFGAVLAAAAACRAVATGAALFIREPAQRAPRPEGASPSVIRDRVFTATLAGTAVMALLYGWYDTVVPIHLETQGFSVSTWGAVYAAGALFMAAIAIPTARRIDRRPRYAGWVAVGAAAYAAGFALVLPGRLGLVLAAIAFFAVAQVVLNPLESSLAARLAPAGRTGAYQGALSVVYACAFATGPVLGLGLYDATSPEVTFATAAAVVCLGAAVLAGAVLRATTLGRLTLTARDRAAKVPDVALTTQARAAVLEEQAGEDRIKALLEQRARPAPTGWAPSFGALLTLIGVAVIAGVIVAQFVTNAWDDLEPNEFVTAVTAGLALALAGAALHGYTLSVRRQERADEQRRLDDRIAHERKELERHRARQEDL